MPSQWYSETSRIGGAHAAGTYWWERFNDADLNDLIGRALANNPDRALAQARILEARAQAQEQRAVLFPQIGAEADASRYNLGNATFNQRFSYYQAGFDASYELDLFGGNRRRAEAGKAGAQASEAAYDDITLTLTAEVARHYILFRQYQQQAVLAADAEQAQRQWLELIRAQRAKGLASGISLSQAEAQYRDMKARLPQLEAQRDAEGFQLSVLLGENPGRVSDALKAVKPLPAPPVLTMLKAPADVIAGRPDVRMAERSLAAATAMQGVATSELFPKITLSGLFGLQDSIAFGNNPVWSAIAAVTMPVLDFGRVESHIRQADARQTMAFQSYRKTVIGALGEVETALTNLGKEGQRHEDLSAEVAEQEKQLALTSARHKEGLARLSEVLLAQQRLDEQQSQLLDSSSRLAQYDIALTKALGIYQFKK